MKQFLNIAFPIVGDDVYGQLFKMNRVSEFSKAVSSNFVHFLSTNVNERFFKPYWGTNFIGLLHEQNDAQTETAIKNELTKKTEKYMPKIKILSVSILRETSKLNVQVKYSYTDDFFIDASSFVDTVSLEFNIE